MNVHLLIDAVVRQTTVFLAQLATAGGVRATLGHTASQVFLELNSELRRQGLSSKLVADLFGLSLRTYHNKVRRLSESSTERGQPLWNAVLDHVQARGTVSRADVLLHFCRDDGVVVKSVLNDLVDSGLVFAKGTGDSLAYRAAAPEELSVGEASGDEELARVRLVWILVARSSPIARDALAELSQLGEGELGRALSQLERDGMIVRQERDGTAFYHSDECLIPLGASSGWEASVFDHYQAVVTTICTKLSMGTGRAERGEQVGGSTYSFRVWPGHPLYAEGLGLLQEMRDRLAGFRSRVDDLNRELAEPEHDVCRVTTYVGQTVTDLTEQTENGQ